MANGSNNSDDLVERIVSGVLSQLGAGRAPEKPAIGATAAPTTDGIRIDDDVVTAALLQERGVRSGPVVFGGRTVLTPSAREYLGGKKIPWSREDSGKSGSASPGRWLAIVAKSTAAAVAAVAGAKKDGACRWKQEIVGCHREAANRAVSALCRGDCDGAVVFTRKPEAVACLANRNPAVRGGTVTSLSRIRAVAEQLGANLLVIDPSDRTEFELRKLLTAIGASGKPVPPPNWNS